MTLRRAAALPALMLTLTLTGCGGGDDKADGAKDTAPTAMQAQAAAAAINLKASDLPSDYKGTPSEDDPAVDKADQEFATCLGSSAPGTEIAEVSSEDFSSGSQLQQLQVSSDVTVVPSTEVARKDLAAYKGEKAISCISTQIAALLKAGVDDAPVTFGAPEVTTLETDAGGTDGAFGYSVKVTATAQGLTIPFEVSFQGLLQDHTQVGLTTLAVGRTFPADLRATLFGTLTERAKDKAV